MKICKSCGASINEDSRFCTNCGADTFADGAAEQTVVNADASAQPETDHAAPEQSGETYYQPEGDSTVSGGEYYQPAAENTENTASAYTYAVPTDQTPVGKGKKKKSVWAIVAAVIIVLGVVVRIGFGALGIFGDVVDKVSTISEGSTTLTEYVNDSLNLKIDVSNTTMQTVSDRDLRNYFNVDPDDYETVIYDNNTGEMIVIFLFEGSVSETVQNMKDFVREEAEYYYEGESDYEISEVYEKTFGGKTYTCVDISQYVKDDAYGDYYTEETLCIYRTGSNFIEIQIFTYPEETGNNAQKIMDQCFKSIK